MRILYDHQIFSIQKFGGITKYFCELFKRLQPEHQFKLSVLFSDNYYLKLDNKFSKVNNILPEGNFKGKHFAKKILYSINQQYSKRKITSFDFDLFHPTFYDDYFLGALKKPYILTVHDLILFKCKPKTGGSDYRMIQMKKVIENANRIIAISHNTKKDLIEILEINEDKIDVVYHGYDEINNHRKSEELGNYILYVGRRGFYKNFKAFAKSISPLLKREKDLKLVCVGEPFKDTESEFFRELGISAQTIAMNVSEDKLNELYYNALVFVFPSLYEGFGMPILEAFANDCPVCLSTASCFPEIAGDAAAFFDPKDNDSILATVEKVISDRNYAESLKQAGRGQLKKYSWAKTVQETVNTYKRAILD